MIKSKQQELKANILLLSVAIAWGTTFLIVQDAIKNVPVFAFLFYRFGIATIIMFLISYNRLKTISFYDIKAGIVLGIVLFLAYSTQTFALEYTQSSIVAFLTGFFVILVPFVSYIFFRVNIKKNVIIGSILAFIGIYFLTMSGELSFGIGEALAFICAIFFAFHLIVTDKFSKKGDVFIIVSFQLLSVSVMSLLFSLIFEEVTFDIQFNFVFIKAILITSIFATVYAFLIQTYMQQFTTATKTAIIFTMEPLSAAFYGSFVGGEVFLQIQILGAFLIVLATLIAQIKIDK